MISAHPRLRSLRSVAGAILLGAGLLSPAPAVAQRLASQTVSGPAAQRETRLDEEAVYRLLRQQLEALVVAQDEARAEHGGFARRFGRGPQSLEFVPSPGVTVQLEFASRMGWVATASHRALAGKTCVIWVGMVHPDRRPATAFDRNTGNEAEIVCDLVP